MSISIPIRVEGRVEGTLSGIVDQSEAFIKIYVLTNQRPVFCRQFLDQNIALTSQMRDEGNIGGEMKTQGEENIEETRRSFRLQLTYKECSESSES